MRIKFLSSIILAGIFLAVASVSAQGLQQSILGYVKGPCLECGNCSMCDLLSIVTRFADILVAFSGVAALLMFVWGGMTMIMAFGDQSKVTSGKNTVIAAVIGIIIVMGAFVFVNTVMKGLGYNGSWNTCDIQTAAEPCTN